MFKLNVLKKLNSFGGGYCPDLVVFIAQSGFMFAKPIAEYLECEMAAILAKRPGNDTKDSLRKHIRYIPKWLLYAALSSKSMYSYNDTHEMREIIPSEHLMKQAYKGTYRKILLVDDSTDTGLSLLNAKETLRKLFPGAEIRTFCYCVISLSEKRVKVDYSRYKDTIIVTATSRYSKEHEAFLTELSEWMSKQGEVVT